MKSSVNGCQLLIEATLKAIPADAEEIDLSRA
jgi:hypothetical protein